MPRNGEGPVRPRSTSPAGSRFVAAVLGAAAVSVVWIAVITAHATSPDEARDRRAEPALPPPAAKVSRTVLSQVTWHECRRDREVVPVQAQPVRPGFRPVVTFVSRAGARVATGRVLARVADQPLVAVVTRGVFYRDLLVGERGEDVRALEAALHQAGIVRAPDDLLDDGTVSAWRRSYDGSGPSDRIRLSTVVAVPAASEVTDVVAEVGQVVRSGTVLMTVASASKRFRCDVPDPAPGLTPLAMRFMVGNRSVGVADVVVHPRSSGGPGGVDVKPRSSPGSDTALLGIVASRTAGAVLAVPLSAVRTGADGLPSVVILEGRRQRAVGVSLGMTADGLVEVVSGVLTEGMLVVIGDEGIGPAGSSSGDDVDLPRDEAR